MPHSIKKLFSVYNILGRSDKRFKNLQFEFPSRKIREIPLINIRYLDAYPYDESHDLFFPPRVVEATSQLRTKKIKLLSNTSTGAECILPE